MNTRIKGEKYRYLLMAYKLCLENGGRFVIQEPLSERVFRINENEYATEIKLLRETRTKNCFSEDRYFEICGKDEFPRIYPYINESGDDRSRWDHQPEQEINKRKPRLA